MAVETESVFKHNLNMNSFRELAVDLSQRLKATVRYGYQDSHDIEKEMQGSESTHTTIIIESIEYPGTELEFFLEDQDYQYRTFYEKHGDAVFEHDYFKQDKNVYLIEKIRNIANKEPNFWLECIKEPENEMFKYQYAFIYKEIIHSSLIWFYDWGYFTMHFTLEEFDISEPDLLNELRKEQKIMMELLGGKDLLYISEQGEIQRIVDEEKFITWDSFMQQIRNLYPDRIFNVSGFMQKRELIPIIREGHWLPLNGQELRNYFVDGDTYKNQLPLVFFDDFADLK